jgi:uncharacterized protein (TIGR02217 family)
MSSFHDVRFPTAISYGSSGGPMFSTTIMALNSGFERRNINWSKVRASYEAVHGVKSSEDMEEILAFFYARMGRAYSFRFKDWADYNTGLQLIGLGDGEKTKFQITKSYNSGGYQYFRDITKIVYQDDDGEPLNTLENVTVGETPQEMDTDFTLDPNTGIITFAVPPAEGVAVRIENAEFDVHVRFDTDHLNAVHDFWETQTWPSIPLVEIKEDIQ